MYQLADLIGGQFGDKFETLEQAERELQLAIQEAQALNEAETPDGYPVPDASTFIFIVNAQTGEQI